MVNPLFILLHVDERILCKIDTQQAKAYGIRSAYRLVETSDQDLNDGGSSFFVQKEANP